jgi:hypothetical protein
VSKSLSSARIPFDECFDDLFIDIELKDASIPEEETVLGMPDDGPEFAEEDDDEDEDDEEDDERDPDEVNG